MGQPCYLANDKYEGFLQTTYNPGESIFALDNLPLNVPTIVVSAPGTEYEAVFTVTGKTINALTGVTRIRGYNGVLVEGTVLTCLNNEEFINQYNNVSVPAGGNTNDVLKKKSEVDNDIEWGEIQAIPLGGNTNDVLKKKSNADNDIEWGTSDAQSLNGFSATQITPVGVVLPYAGASAPSQFLLCDGSAVSRTTYANLFAIIGTTYGVGDDSTTFNLPNLKGRVPVGKSTDTEFDVLGETGGAKTHTLTTAQMPSHNHAVMTNLNHGDGTIVTDEYMNTSLAYGTCRRRYTNYQENRGSDQAHNNLQPYITLNYIIRY